MNDISIHVVEVSGVLLIIVRDNRWLKVDWLLRWWFLVIMAVVIARASCSARRWRAVYRLGLGTTNHRLPRILVRREGSPVSLHLDVMLAFLLVVRFEKPATRRMSCAIMTLENGI